MKPFEESRAITSNILACYHRANSHDLVEGLNWYDTANQIASTLADRYSLTVAASAGVIAALSPGLRWDLNIEHAETLISEWRGRVARKNMSAVGTYGRRNVDKSLAILKGKPPLEVLGGNKVRAFYACIIDPEQSAAVCVDRHAKCLALGVKNSQNSLVRPSEYEYLAEHYRIAAASLCLRPLQVQACSWLVWRRVNGVLDSQDLPF